MDDATCINRLKSIVGRRHIFTSDRSTKRFRKGFRSGEGDVLAVVQPATLIEYWEVLETCVAANKIVIMQAANTGLTEGSTPNGHYDRDVVLINTCRMDQLRLIKDGKQVISFPGATLFKLEKMLAPLGRQPHSVIGSSCIGASVVGGVCNNSGGSLVERGPAYTEMALFAQIDEQGHLSLVNHLGIDLGHDPIEILTNLENGTYSTAGDSNRKGSDNEYRARVRDVDAPTPARFNADKRRLYEASGCAGKLAVFAVRLDTFEKNDTETTFYIGANTIAPLTELRRRILRDFKNLPVSAEYMHEDVFDISDRYGKDTMVMIDKLGTDRLPTFFAIKGWVDARLENIPLLTNFTDRFMQVLSRLWPDVLPRRLREYREKHPHHLILKMHGAGIAEARNLLAEMAQDNALSYFECSAREAKMAGLLRFAAAGAAIRYAAVHSDTCQDIIALDIALRRNDTDFLETLPDEISQHLSHALYYGHFMCHVMHQDYIVKKGADPKAIKAKMLELLDARGAEYPAEHNVGHLYAAKPDLANFYKSIDPTNSLNPGIGKMSKRRNYG
ncbi:D-lactate dehydrogenase [Marivivens niveibacter]|uniref:Quinone-dependent D-lactate dehydrogenase n=1 Tax=Marivivens niveibacter TaxID=1930667 RepID=A0A251WVD5_9RHOB|nr:D-lactate dehydrogenase [Marivivens niveibacter]OUD08306.1 D-lactate dehydrogenase [Marivivens niveibacter]